LLRFAALEVPLLRPAIISAGTRAALDELCGFRYKLRHTYLLELDGTRTMALAAIAASTHADLVVDLEHFAGWLAALATAASKEAGD